MRKIYFTIHGHGFLKRPQIERMTYPPFAERFSRTSMSAEEGGGESHDPALTIFGRKAEMTGLELQMVHSPTFAMRVFQHSSHLATCDASVLAFADPARPQAALSVYEERRGACVRPANFARRRLEGTVVRGDI